MKPSLPQLLETCKTQGIQLSLDGPNQLAIDAPKGIVTSELLAQLQIHKPAILNFLKTGEIVLDAQTATVPEVKAALWFFNSTRIGNSDVVISQTQTIESGK